MAEITIKITSTDSEADIRSAFDRVCRIASGFRSETPQPEGELSSTLTEQAEESPAPLPPIADITEIRESPAPAPQPEAPVAPAPAPQPEAPVAPTPEPEAADTVYDVDSLDSAGVPWISDIHSEGRTRIKDGTWKLKRGVDKELAERLIAEAKGEDITPPEAPEAPVPAPPAPPVPAPPAPPAPEVPSSAPKTFNEFMLFVSAPLKDGRLSMANVTQVIQALGFKSLPLFAVADAGHFEDAADILREQMS